MVRTTRNAVVSRLLSYRNFCSSNKIPVFPIVGSVVALWIYHLASQLERLYDNEASKLNVARKATCEVWRGREGCEEVGEEMVRNKVLSEFLRERREWDKEWKRGKDRSRGKGKEVVRPKTKGESVV